MNWKDLPSLSSLRAFAALAECGSATAAGERLNVSHAAISQQVRALEGRLNARLVEKEGRTLSLTADGRLLAAALLDGFHRIGEAIDALVEADASRPLKITTTPNFAATWLMPRLAEFTTRFPEHEVMLNPTPDVADVGPDGFDIAVRFGSGNWPGTEARLLLPSSFVIVGACELVGKTDLLAPGELLKLPWLQETGTTEVTDWLRQQGMTEARVKRMTHLPGMFILDAVRRGEGVSAVSRVFVEDEIADGRLRILYETGAPDMGYHIVTAPGVARAAVRDMSAWLRKQARLSGPG